MIYDFTNIIYIGFSVFNTIGAVFYLKQIKGITDLQSYPHSHNLMNWFVWVGANSTMASSFYSKSGHLDSAVVLSSLNAVMCLIIFGVIKFKQVKYKYTIQMGGVHNA